MRFIVLGSGTALPDPARGPAGFAVQVAGQTWLVDAGAGTTQRAARAGLDVLGLAGGVFSHRHPDHTGDLIGLLFAFKVGRRTTPWPLWAGAGFTAFLDAVTAPWGHWLRGCPTPVTELPLDRAATAHLGPLTLHTAPARHSAGALHLAFEADGHRVVFSGDTGPSEALVELARGADLLVVECGSSPANPVPDHLGPDDVSALLEGARPRETWLTHFYPGSEPDAVVARLRAEGHHVRRAADGDAWSGPSLSASTAPR